jgi:predicted MFS family arabinose efflux permease
VLPLLAIALGAIGICTEGFMLAGLLNVTLSLNASATYLGISLGAVLGSAAVSHGGTLTLGYVAAACELLALLALRRAPEATPAAWSNAKS